jgi:hypothetical protein
MLLVQSFATVHPLSRRTGCLLVCQAQDLNIFARSVRQMRVRVAEFRSPRLWSRGNSSRRKWQQQFLIFFVIQVLTCTFCTIPFAADSSHLNVMRLRLKHGTRWLLTLIPNILALFADVVGAFNDDDAGSRAARTEAAAATSNAALGRGMRTRRPASLRLGDLVEIRRYTITRARC